MSNNTVGTIYRLIIDEVIESSRVDFEEGGIEEIVLEDLRKGWQAKLTKMSIATFPWDPPPPAPATVPTPVPATNSTPNQAAGASPAPIQVDGVPSHTDIQLSHPPNAQPLPPLAHGLSDPSQLTNTDQLQPDANVKHELQVKQEFAGNGMPTARSGNGLPQYGGSSSGPGALAAQRAVTQLQNQYGARAAASISAIQGFGQTGQSQPAGAPSQSSNQAQRPASQEQCSQHLVNQTVTLAQSRPQHGNAAVAFPGQQRSGSSQQNGFQQSQVDGAGDEEAFEGVLMRRDGISEARKLSLMGIDRMLHEQMTARAKQMEGGGLMLALKQATKVKSVAQKPGPAGASGFDGIDDDIKEQNIDADENDEDAINSDLDDPNEVDLEREDDDENIDQVMLCMYDKVQRVKNKWKCTLKDGVLNVNGKDYVFHKATGEYEW